jgi:uncharacterized membrane protein (DUF4010 family)
MNFLEYTATRVAIAIGIGLLIGVERERRKGSGPTRAPAGVRTFTLTALFGALSLIVGGEMVLAIGLVFIGGAILVSYRRTHQQDPGLTTEVALLTTFLLGAMAMQQPGLAAGIGVVVTVVLAVRNQLHRFVNTGISEQEVHDALILAAAVLVVLPLLPDKNLGPFQVFNPHALWRIVVLVLTLSAAGYIATRLLGVRYGLPLTGLASGFVSSAMTIGVMGARAAREPLLFKAAVAGAVLSTVATVVQLVVILAATSMALLKLLALPLSLAGLAAIAYAAWIARRNHGDSTTPAFRLGRALDIKVAVIFATLVVAILLLTAMLNHWLGNYAVLATALIAGAADAHSVSISIATLYEAHSMTDLHACLAVLAAVTTNTVVKFLAARVSGDVAFARALLPGLIAVVLCAWLGLGLNVALGQW